MIRFGSNPAFLLDAVSIRRGSVFSNYPCQHPFSCFNNNYSSSENPPYGSTRSVAKSLDAN